jgi:hypothetical protein
MKIPAIKKAVESYNIEQLLQAENDIINEKSLSIDLGGSDDGENLTHALAAIWIIKEMKLQKIDFPSALRQYTQKVRSSIS